ncbi:MAG: zinc ribbon domain-containing protein [Flavobacterium sp.]
MALINCKNCGKQISNKANSCIHCGVSTVSAINIENKEQTLSIIWEGQFFLFDVKTEVYINGAFHSKQSTKKGFNIVIPLDNNNIKVKLSLLGLKSTELNLNLYTKFSYEMEIFYDTIWGKYSDKYELKQI